MIQAVARNRPNGMWCLCLFLVPGQAVNQQNNRFLPPPTALAAKAGNYSASFTTMRVDVPESQADAYWGTDRAIKGALEIAQLTISHKKESITVPVSSYAGLLSPWKLAIIPTRGGCKVRIVGSDAAGAYTCVLYIKGDKVVERTVHGGEFPEHNEVTYYHYLNPNEID